jgi:hypothetical protein
VEAPVLVLEVGGLFPKSLRFFVGIGEEGQDNCFDCFPDFWHGFCHFIEEWTVGTIGNNCDGDQRPLTECGEKQRGTIKKLSPNGESRIAKKKRVR